jgi:hypothetical protein
MPVTSGAFKEFTIDPIDYWMTDDLDVRVVTKIGSMTQIFTFKIDLNFKITIQIDLDAFDYNSTAPVVNKKIDAWVSFTYPVSYGYYYLDFNRVIDKSLYVVQRKVGGTILNFSLSDPLIMPVSVYDIAGIGMGGNIPVPGQVDRIVFKVRGPVLAQITPGAFNGTNYTQSFSLQSSLIFDEVDVTITPSFTDFEKNSSERWNVTMDGISIDFTVDVQNNIHFYIDKSLPGNHVIVILHYYETESPEPPPKDLLTIIIEFLVGIVASILALLGITLFIRRRGDPGGMDPVVPPAPFL